MSKIIVFESKKIRRIWHREEWYFSIVDVCLALTDSANAGAYWGKLKQRLMREVSEPVTFCHGLKILAPDGKMRETDCANTEGVFRIIQSIPSTKAEPFKRWLASVGYERVQEIENPELAQERMKQLYEQKGYSKDWIDKRDHMTDLELIFTMLGEKVTSEISKKEKPNTFDKNKKVAKRGGSVAGKARKDTEKEIGSDVISRDNYLENTKKLSGE